MLMVILLASVVAYGLQNVLMGGLFRRHNLGVLVTMRGITLGLVMAPLVLLADRADWRSLALAWPVLLLACATAVLSNLSQAAAVRHLPMGVAYALCMVANALVAIAYGVWLFDEHPGVGAIICGTVVVACSVLLALVGSRVSDQQPHKDDASSQKSFLRVFSRVLRVLGLMVLSQLLNCRRGRSRG